MMARPVEIHSQALSWRLLAWREWLCVFTLACTSGRGRGLQALSVVLGGKTMSQVETEWPESAISESIGRQMLKPNKYTGNWTRAVSAQEERLAEQKRSRQLYGDALEDVDFLRRCGWAINLTLAGQVQFGNQLLTLKELRKKAERERRLRQPAPTASLSSFFGRLKDSHI